MREIPEPTNSVPLTGGHASDLLPAVYKELRALAEHRLRTLSPGATIQPTELLHEAYLRLVKADDALFETKRHFIAAAALAMRSVLVDRARARNAQKRGGGQRWASLDDLPLSPDRPAEDVLAIDAALTELESTDPRSAQVVILRFYLGLTEPEIAEALGITDRTVRRDWTFAKLWLQRVMAKQSETDKDTRQ